MIAIVSLICTIFILLILLFALEYRSRSRRALARRMRYYASGMENTQDQPQEKKTLKERFLGILRGGGRLLNNIRHARGLDLKMQQAGIPLLGTEFVLLMVISAIIAGAVGIILSDRWHVGIMAAVMVVALE